MGDKNFEWYGATEEDAEHWTLLGPSTMTLDEALDEALHSFAPDPGDFVFVQECDKQVLSTAGFVEYFFEDYDDADEPRWEFVIDSFMSDFNEQCWMDDVEELSEDVEDPIPILKAAWPDRDKMQTDFDAWAERNRPKFPTSYMFDQCRNHGSRQAVEI